MKYLGFGMFGLAVLLSVFGQKLAYAMNDVYPGLWPIYYLILLTITGYVLFAVSIMAVVYRVKKEGRGAASLALLIPVMIITSGWSFFVMMMWVG